MVKQKTVQSLDELHQNYLGEIWGDYNKRLKFIKDETKEFNEIQEDYYSKLLEYISKSAEILIHY